MADIEQLQKDLKQATIEMNPVELSKNFIDGYPYNLKFFTDDNLKNFDSNNEIACEQFVNSLKHDRKGKEYKFDLRQQILLNTDDPSDKIIAENCYRYYAQGNGREFDWKNNGKTPPKATALISSSMLCFNAFSHVDKGHPIEIKKVVYDKVFFEAKLPTLKVSRNHPANMDAILISKDGETILFIESKFTETFGSRHSYKQIVAAKKPSLSEKYYSEKNYFSKLGENWVSFIEKYIKNIENIDILPEEGSHLDLKQNLCHCIGIYNFANRTKTGENCNKIYSKWKGVDSEPGSPKLELKDISKYIFMNLEYEPDEDEKKYSELHKCYKEAKKYGESFGTAVKKANIFKLNTFEYYFYSYKDFANECLPEGKHKEKFMEKYLIKKTEGE